MSIDGPGSVSEFVCDSLNMMINYFVSTVYFSFERNGDLGAISINPPPLIVTRSL